MDWFVIDAWHYYLLWCIVLGVFVMISATVAIPCGIAEAVVMETEEVPATLGCMHFVMLPLRVLLGAVFAYNAYYLGFLFLSGWIVSGTISGALNSVGERRRERREKEKLAKGK